MGLHEGKYVIEGLLESFHELRSIRHFSISEARNSDHDLVWASKKGLGLKKGDIYECGVPLLIK